MTKQAVVIGLGQFGLSLVHALSALHVEVLAVDRNEKRVRAAVTAASGACFDATDEEALAKTAPQRRDICVCAIGDEARDAAFITTALLRQLGAPKIFARASNPLDERILRLVGAHEVVNPEAAFGERLAAHLAIDSVLGEYRLSDGLTITELLAPPAFVGRTLIELSLPRRHGITVVARQRDGVARAAVDPNEPIAEGDVLIVVAAEGVVANLLQRLE